MSKHFTFITMYDRKFCPDVKFFPDIDFLNREDESKNSRLKIEYENGHTGEKYDYEYEF